ncbi:MAG: hypothetical protein IPM16_13310 [Chloroflexi bacterium]|nr:hypothetical protein [Chloroflexota bacterium]
MSVWKLPGGWVELRSLNGHDERGIDNSDLPAALGLIDRVLVARTGALAGPGNAAGLTSPLRDRVLAGIYVHTYGDLIASSPQCARCDARYDLSFALTDVLAALPMQSIGSDGTFEHDGTRFRLPTGADELAVMGLRADDARRELARRCTVDGAADVDAVEAAMEAVAPLINVDLDATCPECGAVQHIRFDIGQYLLKRLIDDQKRLPNEVHALAVAYHWGLDEILSLSRTERRRYLALIERSAGSGTRSAVGTLRRTGA